MRLQVVLVAFDLSACAGKGIVGRAALPRAWPVVESPVSSRLMPMDSSQPVLCLASVSPRRRQLLSQIGVSYIAMGADIDETVLPGETPQQHAARLARAKALALRRAGQALPVLAADTTVVLDERIFGKPRDAAE